jgi:hypothetical protein
VDIRCCQRQSNPKQGTSFLLHRNNLTVKNLSGLLLNCFYKIASFFLYFPVFFNSYSGGWSPTGSTRHVGHQLTYCTCPGWLWGWRILWNDDWQGKQKYSEKTFPSTTLSTTNPTWPDRARTQAAAVGSRRLTACDMSLPFSYHQLQESLNNRKKRELIFLH